MLPRLVTPLSFHGQQQTRFASAQIEVRGNGGIEFFRDSQWFVYATVLFETLFWGYYRLLKVHSGNRRVRVLQIHRGDDQRWALQSPSLDLSLIRDAFKSSQTSR